MAQMHTFKRTSQLDNGSVVASQEDVSADGSVSLDVTVPAGTTNGLYAIGSINPAKLRSLMMLATQQGLTVKANSSGSPTNTYSLVAGVMLEWSADAAYFANPVASTITSIYVTNAGSSAARLRIRAGVNA